MGNLYGYRADKYDLLNLGENNVEILTVDSNFDVIIME